MTTNWGGDTEKQTKSVFVNRFVHCVVINYLPHRKYAELTESTGCPLIVSRWWHTRGMWQNWRSTTVEWIFRAAGGTRRTLREETRSVWSSSSPTTRSESPGRGARQTYRRAGKESGGLTMGPEMNKWVIYWVRDQWDGGHGGGRAETISL